MKPRLCKKCGARTRRTGETYVYRTFGVPIGVVRLRACPKCLARSREMVRSMKSTQQHMLGIAPLVVHCRKAQYDVYVGRPGPFGNPFSWKDGTLAVWKTTQDGCLPAYEAWLLSQPELVARVKRELRSKVLGCWCKPGPCHGDILARIANEEG